MATAIIEEDLGGLHVSICHFCIPALTWLDREDALADVVNWNPRCSDLECHGASATTLLWPSSARGSPAVCRRSRPRRRRRRAALVRRRRGHLHSRRALPPPLRAAFRVPVGRLPRLRDAGRG